MYHGSMATHDWFPEIFGTPDTCTTLLTLVTSRGQPTPHGALPGALSSLDALPLTVEIYRSVPFLPPSYIGHPGSQMHLTLPEPGLSLPFDGAHISHVYFAFHTTTGYSPLHQAVLRALWGILRALWDHRSSLSDTFLVLHIPDSALVKSLIPPELILQRDHGMASCPGPAPPVSAGIHSAYSPGFNSLSGRHSRGARYTSGALLRPHRHLPSVLRLPSTSDPSYGALLRDSSSS